MKLIVGMVLLLGLILSVVLAAFYFGQRQLIYFPKMTQADAAASSNFQLKRPGGVHLRGWQDRPEQARALLYFGGNAETLQPARAQLTECCPDWTAYFVPYRGYGNSDGSPSRDALLADALAIYDEVAKRHPDQPIAVIGRSLGSGVASWVASQRPAARLVLITPFDSLSNVAKTHYRWLPVEWLMHERYDSVDWLQARREPTMVIRASDDQVVPAANTDALLAALPQTTTVVRVEGDHNSVSGNPAYARALKDFLR